MKRNHTIDIVKGLGIFLVILGHNPNPLNGYIFSFHMPLFFILGGIYHSSKGEYLTFLKKKANALLVPYISFSISLFLFWLVIGRKFGGIAKLNTPILHSLNGILIGTNIPGLSSMVWGGPLWFVLCIF
ncbi:MAG: acyltransferase family protein, partial [Fusobacteriaceae bacterium]